MKIEELQKLVKDNTLENGEINWGKVSEAINAETNGLITKAKGETSKEALDNLYKGLGYENGDKFNEEFKMFKASHETLGKRDEEIKTLKENATLYEKTNLIRKLGVMDEGQLDYIMFQVNKGVKDDVTFDQALTNYKAANPNLFQTVPTFGSFVNPNPTPEKLGFEKILEEKHPDIKL